VESFLPLLLMVVVSWSVFWFDPPEVSSQVQIAVTNNSDNHRLCAGDLIDPAASAISDFRRRFFSDLLYFRLRSDARIDRSAYAYCNDRRKVATEIRRTARWLVPVLFVVINSILIIHFLA